MGIKHSVVKTPESKGLSSEWNDNHIIDGNVDLGQYQFLDQVIENRTDFPAGPVEGQIIYRTDLNICYQYNGSTWDALTPGIGKGTHYWSCTGVNFIQQEFDSLNENLYDEDEGTLYYRKTTGALGEIHLPHGAVVTKISVYGDFGNWYLTRKSLPYNTFDTMANGAGQGSDITINQATIDNENWAYFLTIYGTNDTSQIDGVVITYTL